MHLHTHIEQSCTARKRVRNGRRREILIRHRAWPDSHTDQQPFHIQLSSCITFPYIFHACSSLNHPDPSLSPPLVPPLSIPLQVLCNPQMLFLCPHIFHVPQAAPSVCKVLWQPLPLTHCHGCHLQAQGADGSPVTALAGLHFSYWVIWVP